MVRKACRKPGTASPPRSRKTKEAKNRTPAKRARTRDGGARGWLASARHKPSHEAKSTAEVLERHPSGVPIPTSASFHHPASNPLKDDPLAKDARVGHKGSTFAGDAVQSSRAALGSPGPGIWPLRKCFCSTCNFTHHCIGLVILLLEPCFAVGETLVPRQKNSTGFSPWITDSEFQATYSKN